jgi:signal transduction histidine kinase
LQVNWDIDETVPPVTTDPIKLEEILQNLIANAYKFTPKGRIDVSVRNVRDRDRVQFSVADTGIGIEAEDVAGYSRSSSKSKRLIPGNCLLGGEIQVESEPGQGSIFTFSIPRSLRRHAA